MWLSHSWLCLNLLKAIYNTLVFTIQLIQTISCKVATSDKLEVLEINTEERVSVFNIPDRDPSKNVVEKKLYDKTTSANVSKIWKIIDIDNYIGWTWTCFFSYCAEFQLFSNGIVQAITKILFSYAIYEIYEKQQLLTLNLFFFSLVTIFILNFKLSPTFAIKVWIYAINTCGYRRYINCFLLLSFDYIHLHFESCVSDTLELILSQTLCIDT